MTPRAFAIAVAVLGAAAPGPAKAEPHKLLVMQSEGRVDGSTRAKIDAAVLRLAQASEPQASPGDLNFSDAATAVGCKPDAASCKDEVMGMLAVDEIVITTLARKPGGIEVNVRRVGKGGASREATMMIATGAPPDKLDGIAPLFDAAAVAAPAPAPAAPAPTPVAPSPPPAVATTERPVDTATPPTLPPPADVKPAAPPLVATPAPTEPAAPPPIDQPDQGRRRLELIGMASGGGMVLLGFVLWASASSVQSNIDHAPA